MRKHANILQYTAVMLGDIHADQRIWVFSSIHSQLKCTISTVDLHQKKSAIKGLVKRIYIFILIVLLWKYPHVSSLLGHCQEGNNQLCTFILESRESLLGIFEM